MKALKLALVPLLALLVTGCGVIKKDKSAAENAIAQFHQLFNHGGLEPIWQGADPAFRTASTKQQYDNLMAAVLRKLGRVTSTANTGWNLQSFNLKTTIHMGQHTTFEHGQGDETFTFLIHGTNAVLLGYNIQSMDLVTQ